MKIIDQPRPEDELETFGTLLRFQGLVYENEDEGEANAPFGPYNIDGDVVFFENRPAANRAFDVWTASLKAAEDQFLDEGDEEGFLALFETPRGLMILAGSNIMGYPDPGVDSLPSVTRRRLGMTHVSWDKILQELFGE